MKQETTKQMFCQNYEKFFKRSCELVKDEICSQDLLDGVELRTRYSSSSAFTDSPAHSHHGGSPLHYYHPGKKPTQVKTHTLRKE